MNKAVAGTLRIGTFTSASTRWLPAIIRGFQTLYPQVEFEPLAGDYNEITQRILSGKIDCGFLTAPVADALSFFPLYQDPMMAVLPIGHPLEKEISLTLSDIKKEPLILPLKGCDNDILAVLNCDNQKINIRYTLNDYFSVMAMVAGGFGITIMSDLILRNSTFPLTIRPIRPTPYRTIGIAALPMDRVTNLTKIFIQYLSNPRSINLGEISRR